MTEKLFTGMLRINQPTFERTFEEAVENLEVFNRLRGTGLKLKPKKCDLFAKTVFFLGHTISDEGIASDPDKFKVLKKWPTLNHLF